MLGTILPTNVFATMNQDVAQPDEQFEVKEGSYKPDEILVKFKNDEYRISNTAEVHSLLGGTQVQQLGNGKSEWQLVKVPKGKAKDFKEKYANDPSVESAELNLIYTVDYTPNDPSLSQQWHHQTINSYGAWDTIKGSSKKIAIIDTGVQLNHPDLQNSLLPGKSFVAGVTSANDDHGHGTHCAGISAAIGDNGIGISGIDATAKIIPVKVLNKQGSGYTSDIINGVIWATDNGADVLSMSLGGGSYQQSFQDAINYAWNKNKIIVAAAGNSSTSAYSYPAAYNNVVAVAATNETDGTAYFSNYGTWVDIAAPGTNIYSTYTGSSYKNLNGTSMATPIVSAVLALTWGKNTAYTNQQVVNRVLSTADQTPDTGTDYLNGRVNVYNAVQ